MRSLSYSCYCLYPNCRILGIVLGHIPPRASPRTGNLFFSGLFGSMKNSKDRTRTCHVQVIDRWAFGCVYLAQCWPCNHKFHSRLDRGDHRPHGSFSRRKENRRYVPVNRGYAPPIYPFGILSEPQRGSPSIANVYLYLFLASHSTRITMS